MSDSPLSQLLILSIIIAWQLPSANAQTRAVIQPSSAVATSVDGETTTFTCEVRDADTVGWIVDNISARDSRIVKRDILLSYVETIDSGRGMYKQNLSVPHTCVNRRTEIICVSEKIIGDDFQSRAVSFVVNGCDAQLQNTVTEPSPTESVSMTTSTTVDTTG